MDNLSLIKNFCSLIKFLLSKINFLQPNKSSGVYENSGW